MSTSCESAIHATRLKSARSGAAATDGRNQSEPAGGVVLAGQTRRQQWRERRPQGI